MLRAYRERGTLTGIASVEPTEVVRMLGVDKTQMVSHEATMKGRDSAMDVADASRLLSASTRARCGVLIGVQKRQRPSS
jgi:hypothetical protein